MVDEARTVLEVKQNYPFNSRQTVAEVASIVGISNGSCQVILTGIFRIAKKLPLHSWRGVTTGKV